MLEGENILATAADLMKELRSADESMCDRLFILQLWRKYDQNADELYARRKAGEYLDAELAKVVLSGHISEFPGGDFVATIPLRIRNNHEL